MKTLRTGFSLLIFSCSALTLPIHATGPGAADFEAALLAMSNVDPDAAGPAMRKAAAAGHVEAMFQLAGLHAQGYGVEKSDAEAMRWYGAAADKGHPEAAKSLAAMRATGRNKPAIPTSPALPSPARTSPASDQSAPAELYAAAKPLRLVPARHAEARRLFEQAVAAGHVPSMVDLAEMIATGQGGARDADAALALFRRAADSGETPAVLRLSQLYFRPSIGSYANNAWRDPAAGQALLEKLASAGDLEAMVRLAGVLETGTGGVRDVPRSLEIWEKAVAGGHASARAERDRVRDNLNLSPEQKLARYRAALQRAASHRDPSQQRGFALSNYIGSIYGAGLDLEQTAGIVLPIVKEMIETDFHAVYRGRHVASLPWHDIYNRALDADQLRILTQMERFLARHPGVPDPGIAPGQGWSAAYPDGPPPALATVPKPAPVAAATRPSPAQVTKPATQLSEFTRDATTWDEFFTASARDSVSHRYHAADVKLFLEKHPATTEQLRAAYRRARETVRPTPGTVRGREFGAQFVAYHLAILATGLSEQAAAEFVCDDFQTLARSDVQSAHQVLMGVERPHIPLFRPFLTPQQNQQVRDLAQLVVKRQPLPTVPDPSAPVTVTAATVKTVAPAASPAVALETAATGFQTFEEFPGDFRRNLPGHWELSAKISGNARPQTMEVRFTGPQGTVDTVVANPFASSPNRYSARIQEMREARGLWFKVHFNYRDLRFEGQADQRILSGTVYNKAGQQIGTWTALKRRDLDYLDLAEQANRAKNSEAALHYYSAAIRVNGSAENYASRGSFHYAARNDAAAVTDFTAALERDSSQLNARYNRMLANYNARQHAEALSDADTLLARRTNPLGKEQLALVHQLRGDILWWLERPDEAEKAYAMAKSLDPKMAERTRVAKTRDWALAQKIKRDAEVAQIMNRMNQGITASTEKLRETKLSATPPPPAITSTGSDHALDNADRQDVRINTTELESTIALQSRLAELRKKDVAATVRINADMNQNIAAASARLAALQESPSTLATAAPAPAPVLDDAITFQERIADIYRRSDAENARISAEAKQKLAAFSARREALQAAPPTTTAAALDPAPIHAAIAERGDFQIVNVPDRAVSQNPDQPLEATFPRLQSALAEARGDPQRLLRALEDLVTRHPDRAEPLIARAQVASGLPDQQVLVRTSIESALKIDPFHPQAHNLLARLDVAAGQRERAFRRMAEMAALRPRSIQIATTEAELLILLEAQPAARVALRERIAPLLGTASPPERFAALIASAKLAAGMNDLAAAATDIDAALALNRDPRLLLERAGLRERMENHFGAWADLREVLDSPLGRDPQIAESIRQRLTKLEAAEREAGKIREELARTAGAQKHAEADAKAKASVARAFSSWDFNAGVRAYEAGDVAKAREFWTKAAAAGHQEAAERLKSLPPAQP